MMELFSKIVQGSYQKAPSQMFDRFLNTPCSVFYACIQKGKYCTNIDSICLSDQYCQDSCTEHYECGESFVQPFANRISFFFWLLYLNFDQFFFQLLYLESGFLFVAYLTVANLDRLGISVHCQVSVSSQYLVRFLPQFQTTGGLTIYPPMILNPHHSKIRSPK